MLPHATSHAKARRAGYVSHTKISRGVCNPLFFFRLFLLVAGVLLLSQIYSYFPSFTAWVFGSSTASTSSVIYYNQRLQSDTAVASADNKANVGKPEELRTVLRKARTRISSEKKQKQIDGVPGASMIAPPRDEAPKNAQVLGKPVNWAEKIVPQSWKMFAKQLPESEDARRQRQRNEDEMRAKKELAEEEMRSRDEAIRVADRKRVRREAQRLKKLELEAAIASEKRGKMLQGVMTEEEGKAVKEKAAMDKKAREEEEKKSYIDQKVLDVENALKASVEQKKAHFAQQVKEAALADSSATTDQDERQPSKPVADEVLV